MLRMIFLGMGLTVILSLIGPIYYGFTNGPYWRVILWASVCIVICCWQARQSFRHAWQTAPLSTIGRLLLMAAIVAVIVIAFVAGDSLVFLLVRSI
jgi:hypothetical protein